MTPTELKRRVTVVTCVGAVGLAPLVAGLGGGSAAVGILVGSALSVVNFRWLVTHADLATARAGATGLWFVGAGLRITVFLLVAGTLLATGVAHPVAFLAGLSVLPCAVVAQGLRAARGEG